MRQINFDTYSAYKSFHLQKRRRSVPELPEVEIIKRELTLVLVDQQIVSLEIIDPKLKVKPDDVGGKLIKNLIRKGKYLFWIFSDQSSLLVHLGMTGHFLYTSNREHLPYQRALIVLSEGYLSFCDSRRFGKMQYLTMTEREKVMSSLGIDPLSEDYSWDRFEQLFKDKYLSVKNFLMNQKYLAGIGNIYASEILFLSAIHPEKRVSELSLDEKRTLYSSIPVILNRAIVCEGTTIRDYHHSDGSSGSFQYRLRVYNKEGVPCDVCGTEIRRLKISQRSTYYCPNCQKR